TFAPLVVSTLFILLTSLLAHCARRCVQKVVKETFIRLLLEEAIAAAELCGCCFELIIGKGDIRKAVLKTWAELAGGLLVFKYVQMYWALEISDTHKDKAYEECRADLQVPVIYGAVVEGVATCMCRLASKSLGDLNPRFATAIDSFIGTSLVVAAFEYSGGYFNPVLATSLKAGCDGHTLMEHAIVYWIGACAGSLLSVYMYKLPAFKRFVRTEATVSNGDSIWETKED
ncbi:Aquaporin-12, partial [Operophtera brumata]